MGQQLDRARLAAQIETFERRIAVLKSRLDGPDERPAPDGGAADPDGAAGTPAWLPSLMHCLPNPIYLKDRDGRYLDCNQAFAECILGTDPEAIVGRTITEVTPAIPPELAAVHHRYDRQLIENPGVQVYEAPVPCADGRQREFIFNRATFTDRKGQVAGLVAVMFDLTQRNRRDRAHLEREKLAAAAETAGAACHELNQPLQTALGKIDLMLMDLAAAAPQRPGLERVQAQLERMAAITGRLMSITRYETRPYFQKDRIIDLARASEQG